MILAKRFVVPAILVAFAAVGCTPNQEAATADPTGNASAALDTTTQDGGATEGMAGHPFLGRVKAALATVSLSADQKTKLQAVESALHTQTAPVRAAREALALAVANQVAAGAIDETALATPIANLAQAATNAKPALQTAANALYATLTPAQREQFVAAMKPKGDGFFGHGGHHGPHGELKKLAQELNLTSDQIASIKASAKADWANHDGGAFHEKFAEGKAHMQELAQAFTGPNFDAAALDVGGGLANMAADRPGHMLKLVERILPILTPAQKQQLAAHIQTKASSLADE